MIDITKKTTRYLRPYMLLTLLLIEYVGYVSEVSAPVIGFMQLIVCLTGLLVTRASCVELSFPRQFLYLSGLCLAAGAFALTGFGPYLIPGPYLIYLKLVFFVYIMTQSTPSEMMYTRWVLNYLFRIISIVTAIGLLAFGYDSIQSGAVFYTRYIPGSLTAVCTLLAILLVTTTNLKGKKENIIISLLSATLVGFLASSALLLVCSCVLVVDLLFRYSRLSRPQLVTLFFIVGVASYLLFGDFMITTFTPRWHAVIDSMSYLNGPWEVITGSAGVKTYAWHYGKAISDGAHLPYPGLVHSIAHNDFINVYLFTGLAGVTVVLMLIIGTLKDLGLSTCSLVVIFAAGFPLEQNFSLLILAWAFSQGNSIRLPVAKTLKRYEPIIKKCNLFMLGLIVVVLSAGYFKQIKFAAKIKSPAVDFLKLNHVARYDPQGLNDLYFVAAENLNEAPMLDITQRYAEVAGTYYSFLYLADEYFRRGNYSTASEIYAKASKINPYYSYPLYKIFFCHLNKGDLEKSIQVCEELNAQSQYQKGLYYLVFSEEMRKTLTNY